MLRSKPIRRINKYCTFNHELELIRLTKSKSLKRELRQLTKNKYSDALAQRETLKGLIDDLKVDGKVWIYEWSRDCDQFESDDIHLIPAYLVIYLKRLNRAIDSAEGSLQFFPISEADAHEYRPYWRDIAAEQMGY